MIPVTASVMYDTAFETGCSFQGNLNGPHEVRQGLWNGSFDGIGPDGVEASYGLTQVTRLIIGPHHEDPRVEALVGALFRTLRPGDVVVTDNGSRHTVVGYKAPGRSVMLTDPDGVRWRLTAGFLANATRCTCTLGIERHGKE